MFTRSKQKNIDLANSVHIHKTKRKESLENRGRKVIKDFHKKNF